MEAGQDHRRLHCPHARYPEEPGGVSPAATPRSPGWGSRSPASSVVFSLAVGTVLEAAIGPYKGKQTSELALLRMVIAQFQPGDIFLADRFFCSYWVIAALQARGVDVVVRLHQCRTADFRRGRRLGRKDHIVTWPKPQQIPDWMSRDEYDAMPAFLTVRETRVRVKDKTKRVRNLVIVTTLVDAKDVSGQGAGGPVPPEVACGTGPAIVEDGYAYGDVADQEPGDGAQGGGDASAGVQPDPWDHGRGGAGRRR